MVPNRAGNEKQSRWVRKLGAQGCLRLRDLRRRLSAKLIEEMASDLSEIRQILCEDQEDERAEAATEEQKNR